MAGVATRPAAGAGPRRRARLLAGPRGAGGVPHRGVCHLRSGGVPVHGGGGLSPGRRQWRRRGPPQASVHLGGRGVGRGHPCRVLAAL